MTRTDRAGNPILYRVTLNGSPVAGGIAVGGAAAMEAARILNRENKTDGYDIAPATVEDGYAYHPDWDYRAGLAAYEIHMERRREPAFA